MNNFKTYTLAELHALLGEERHAVRDEALRRHELAARKLIKAKKEVADLETLVFAAM